MDKSTIRQLVLESLLDKSETQLQEVNLAVVERANEHGLTRQQDMPGGGQQIGGRPSRLSKEDGALVVEVIWDLIIDRQLTPGVDADNANWPWLRMNDRGIEAAKSELENT